MKHALVISLLLCASLMLASCNVERSALQANHDRRETLPNAKPSVPIFYSIGLTGQTTPAQQKIVDAFIARKSIATRLTKGSYVAVRLFPKPDGPPVYARPTDLSIPELNLIGFVTYYENGEVSFLPEYTAKIPLEVLLADLRQLCLELDMKQSHVNVGPSYLSDLLNTKKSHNNSMQATPNGAPDG